LSKYKWFLVLTVMSAVALIGPAVGCAAPPVINSFTTSSTSVIKGQSITLSWDVSGADTITLVPGNQTLESSGSLVVTPEYSTGWELRATNKAGSVTKQLNIVVNMPASE
jgi:hypothetical protein